MWLMGGFGMSVIYLYSTRRYEVSRVRYKLHSGKLKKRIIFVSGITSKKRRSNSGKEGLNRRRMVIKTIG